MQVHPTCNGCSASLTAWYHVADGGHLSCWWDPVIPFSRSKLRQSIVIDVDASGTLMWSDAFMCGREASGERWRFDTLAHELRLSRSGQLAYLERYELRPLSDPHLHLRWIAADASYFGTVLIVDERVTRQWAAELHERLCSLGGVHSAADYLEDGIVLVRLMAVRGVAFHAARERIQSAWGQTPV